MPRVNPFRPNNIIQPGMFVGRAAELAALEQGLMQTKNDNSYSFLLHGERGIGKSSLLHYIKLAASGSLEEYLPNMDFHFVTIDIEVDSKTTFPGLISKLTREFSKAVSTNNRWQVVFKDVLNRVQDIELAGIKLSKSSKDVDPHTLMEDLTDTIIEALGRTVSDSDGFLFLIDEIDKPSSETGIGLFIKTACERFAKRGCGRVGFGLSGLSSGIEKMKASHESSIRNVALHHLRPLSPEERKQVVYAGIRAYNKSKPGDEITIEADALVNITHMSEGYPHFLQQFAWSAFEENTDQIISLKDALDGIHKHNGALDQLAQRYFHEMFFDKIKSDEYRGVLRVMADDGDEWVTKADIRRRCPAMKQSTLDNAIRALTERHVIELRDGSRGVYRLINRSFGTWIRVLGARERMELKDLD